MHSRYILLLFVLIAANVFGQVSPENAGELSSTQLINVERSPSAVPNKGPDGLVFNFVVSKTPTGQHHLGIKETRDFKVGDQSYLQLTQTALGRHFEPGTVIDDPAKFAAAHPKLSDIVSAAPADSLVVTVTITGAPLVEGQDVEITLHLGFGRTPDAPSTEDLVFKTEVPSR